MAEAVEFEDAIAFYSEGTSITRNNVNGAVIARNADGKKIGSVITAVSKEGYGGEIEVSVGILDDGTVTGIEILSINETAGLGMRATEPEFKDQFKDIKPGKFVLTKENPSGNIDALSGATITSKAVVAAVNTALDYHHDIIGGGADE